MNNIRNSAKAIIIQEGRILLTQNKDNNGYFYLLPGGGQHPGESIIDALKRECMEEISAQIDVGDIIYLRDYIGKNHEFSEIDADVHQIEYMFFCNLRPDAHVENGKVPDNMQTGVEWIDIAKLKNIRIYPSILKILITPDGINRDRIYLGDEN